MSLTSVCMCVFVYAHLCARWFYIVRAISLYFILYSCAGEIYAPYTCIVAVSLSGYFVYFVCVCVCVHMCTCMDYCVSHCHAWRMRQPRRG